ncbi:MAG: hypothetical protein CO142_00605 [Candidatus Moranbacteria bacterium CG_4_9_14_3_um_filter_44_28]|nr:MAG: hypothetical protein CO142_00605 [Candidatus Moranbacteria bacterium CG_4_9_14_3_um_filter_44_28]
MNNIPYLLLCDYDLTLFNTKDRSPRGIGLAEGYEYAVLQTFGPQGLIYFREGGGLHNRACSEVVVSLVKRDQNLLNIAREKHAELISSSQELLRVIAAPWNESNPIATLSELLVYHKLQLFLEEIGLNWPLPYSGVCDFFQTVTSLREKEGLPIQIGILSSGHTPFIEKTLSLWKIPYPRIMVMDDDIRYLKHPKDPQDKVKPAPFPFKFLQIRWLKQFNGNTPVSPAQLRASLPRIMYFGDDPHKDGGLAKNVGVLFGWFREKNKDETGAYPNELPENFFSFSDWGKVVDFLARRDVKKMLKSGIPLEEIFSHF